MGLYSDYTDEQLADEITQFRAARKAVILGGDGVGTVKRITDGDRTMEYTAANLDALDRELRGLLAEQCRRDGGGGRAIEVEFI